MLGIVEVIILAVGAIFFLAMLYSIYRIFRWWPTRRFRLHLSTTLVLAVFGGSLIGLNIKPGLFDHRDGWSYFFFDPNQGDGYYHKNKDDPAFDRNQSNVLNRFCGFPIGCYKPAYWVYGSGRRRDAFYILSFDFVMCLFVLSWTLLMMEVAHDPKPD